MKPLLLAAALLLPTTALAGVINPDRYAERFCKLRALGVDKREATKAAVQYAIDLSQPDPPMETRYGVTATKDVLDAAQASMQRCPEV